MAGLPDDFNEDDFEDYNPHPYLGGYDIVGTYGEPLPPSPAICYPISSSVSSPPVSSPPVGKVNLPPDELPVKEANNETEPAPAPTAEPAPAPTAEPAPPPTAEPAPPPTAEPEAEKPFITPVVEQPWSEPYEYGEPYQPEPYKPDLFRSWPFSIPQHCCRHKINGQVRDFDYWNHMMRGLDFLFGHAQGYGERRVGVDVYGTAMYANKRTATESMAVHVEQPSVQRLEYHQSSAVQVHPDGLDTHMQWPSWYEEGKEEKTEIYGNSYQSNEYYNYEQHTSYCDLDSSHHDSYDWRYNNLGYSSNVEGESMEETNLFSTPVYSYNKNYHEQPLHVQVQLADETWTQKMISYENNHSSYDEKGEVVHEPNRLSYGYESERYGHTQFEHLEPFKPSWSQNMGYSGEYLEGKMVGSEDYATFYGGEGNVSKAFGYNEGDIYYEQNQSSWSTADSHVLYGEDASTKPSWDNESRNWTDAIFGSSHNYYAYDHYSLVFTE